MNAQIVKTYQQYLFLNLDWRGGKADIWVGSAHACLCLEPAPHTHIIRILKATVCSNGTDMFQVSPHRKKIKKIKH